MSTFKAQYKSAANMQWQTKQSGTEVSCMREYQNLKQKYDFARVIDPNGRVVT
ncbi:hypothetical protein D3C80_659950 [compost metagenome]